MKTINFNNMGKNKFLKIGAIVFFIVLAAYSCYATEHSLHLLSPNLPIILVWAITIAFYIVASYGSKMIVDSLNQNIYVENRKGMLCGGILLLILFWLVVSMPTNTHTFFYNEQICDVVQEDISTTKNYLIQIDESQVTLPEYYTFEKQVNDKHAALTAEFNGLGVSGRKGNGQYVMQLMREINNLMGSNIPVDTRLNVYDITILNRYDTTISKELAKIKRDRFQAPRASVDEARIIIDDLMVIEDTVRVMANVGKPEETIITQTEGVLQNAYSLIKGSKDYVVFNDNDMNIYCAEKITTKTHEMKNVIKVWGEFLKGAYAGKGFIYWILISILVDLGAFIFFDLAFKREEF